MDYSLLSVYLSKLVSATISFRYLRQLKSPKLKTSVTDVLEILLDSKFGNLVGIGSGVGKIREVRAAVA